MGGAGESSGRPRLAALLSLAWPVVLSRSAQAVIGFCDALMSAPLGEHALAATTTGSLNTVAILILPMGVAFIVQSFAAQLSAKDDMDGAQRYGWYGVLLAALAGLFALALTPLVPAAIELTAYSPEVKQLMGGYIELRLLAVAAAVGFEAIGNWYGGLGNTRMQMAASLVMMVVNVALNALLIEGRLGFPALGVEGAALASVIATWTGFGVLAVLFWRDASGSLRAALQPSRVGEFVRMLRFGLPHGLNWFLEFSAFLLFIDVIVAEVGTVTVAAMMVVFQVNSVSYMPSFGLASSGAILAGQAVGRDARDEVPGILRLTMSTAAVWQATVGLLYLLVPGTIMGWFAPRGEATPELVSTGATLLALSAAWQLFDAVAMSTGEALRAAGDTAWPMFARLLLAWIVFLPASYVSVVMWEGGGIAAINCLILYLAMLAAVLVLRFRHGAWRRIELTQ